MPFVPTTLTAVGTGAERRVTCLELETARTGGLPVALYVGREEKDNDDGKAKAEVAATRKFEKELLGSAEAATAAAGWTLLRVDRGDPDAARLASSFGVAQAPAIVLFLPDEAKPIQLDRLTSAGTLVKWFKKGAP